jgi:hypothetical protein
MVGFGVVVGEGLPGAVLWGGVEGGEGKGVEGGEGWKEGRGFSL